MITLGMHCFEEDTVQKKVKLKNEKYLLAFPNVFVKFIRFIPLESNKIYIKNYWIFCNIEKCQNSKVTLHKLP
jgi:hypothetical protein